jgi:hypothetical protein
MLTKQYFSGICVCGHHYKSHHKMMVARAKTVEENPWLNEVGGTYADECLICNGVNGGPGLGDKTGKYCGGYFDIEDPVYLQSINPTD